MAKRGQQESAEIRYSLLNMDHLDVVVDFLLAHFYTEDIPSTTLGLDPEKEVKPWLRTLIEFRLSLSLSVGAWNVKTDELVGVSSNEKKIADVPQLISQYQLITPRFPNIYQNMELLRALHGDLDLFQVYQVKIFGRISMLTVRSDYGGRGIATKLVEISELAFLEQKIPDVYVESTSEYSARAFRARGYSAIAELSYSDYKRDGEVVYKDTGIHKTCRLFVKRLLGPN